MGESGRGRKGRKVTGEPQRNTGRGFHRAAAAWPLHRSIREVSMSKPVPSLLGSTAAASRREGEMTNISTEHAPLSRPHEKIRFQFSSLRLSLASFHEHITPPVASALD
ncbi:hypothetical protein CgunFtcFv8_002695 [Champsocephalus gunnari]|uniref:Uncharacterized protein n=1 Tax=Champsocephalus gunnari TaxID=52237 RepID=A0AAN8D9G0_CHAGU|nr:hypothetical protein CgunFtcFv8_002695 [Champsocephalus gunnari]